MKGKLEGDKRKRKEYNERGSKGRKVLKSVGLGVEVRKGGRYRIRNRCIESNRGRGVVTRWKLSRINLREYGMHGHLWGVGKAVW